MICLVKILQILHCIKLFVVFSFFVVIAQLLIQPRKFCNMHNFLFLLRILSITFLIQRECITMSLVQTL